jgi:hypothetical protein
MRILLETLTRTGGGGNELREDLRRQLENRRHAFLDLTAEGGIPFYIVRGERLEELITLRMDPWR